MDEVGDGDEQVVFWESLPEEGSLISRDSKAELGLAGDSDPEFHVWWGLEVSGPACNYGGEKRSGELVGRVGMGGCCLV